MRESVGSVNVLVECQWIAYRIQMRMTIVSKIYFHTWRRGCWDNIVILIHIPYKSMCFERWRGCWDMACGMMERVEGEGRECKSMGEGEGEI